MITLNKVELEGKTVKELAREFKKFIKAQGVNTKISVTSESRYYGDHIKITLKEEATVEDLEIIKECTMLYNQVVEFMWIGGQLFHYEESEQHKEEIKVKSAEREAERVKILEESEKIYTENVTTDAIGGYETVNVEDKEIFITALVPSINKNDWKTDNDKEIDESSSLAEFKVTDIVKLTKEGYDYFKFNLLEDNDFLTGKKCVVVYAEGEEAIVIDPSGYSYARYTCRLVEDINGNLEREIGETEKGENIIDALEVENTSLYEVEYISDLVIREDERFIYSEYLGRTVVTGLALRELMREGKVRTNIVENRGTVEGFKECLYKIETGQACVIFGGKNPLADIKFSERLEKELTRAKGNNPTDPTPTKRIKRETNAIDNNNVIAVNFSQPSQTQTVNNKKDDSWKTEKATKKQLYALFCMTKVKTNDLDISKGEASELISRAKSGEDIVEDVKRLLDREIKTEAVR